MVNPAYVVGYGMIDALGNNPGDCFLNLINDYNPIQKLDFMGDHKIQYGIPCLHDILLPEAFTPKITANMTRAQQMALHATEQALKMANLKHSSNVAVIVSSVSNDVEFLDGNFQKFKENKRVNPFKIVNRIPDMIVGQITSHYKFHGASVALYASCATGMYSIDYAMRLLDEYDYVVVGGADAGVFEMALKYFAGINALGNSNKPFDTNREGFVMGEGAGILILQSKDKVQQYKSTVHAKLYPVGCASDAFDLTSPATNGIGAKLALDKALDGIEPDTIDVISAHATSTPIGDEVEYIENYIDLQSIRFEKTVEILKDISVNESFQDDFIESMLLIPFIENAFKHGTFVVKGASIEITLYSEGNNLILKTKNKFSHKENIHGETTKNHGIGLSNVKRRLELLYPDKHELKLDTDGEYFNVYLSLQVKE